MRAARAREPERDRAGKAAGLMARVIGWCVSASTRCRVEGPVSRETSRRKDPSRYSIHFYNPYPICNWLDKQNVNTYHQEVKCECEMITAVTRLQRLQYGGIG